MKDITLKLLIGFAILLIGIGFLFAFIDLQLIYIDKSNDGFVAALFSLAGVLFFCSALIYQIKEYKLQVVELKKSVEAQTKSSEALDEQKRILIEQNINGLIFGMISSFNDFRFNNKVQVSIEEILEKEQCYFAFRWENNLRELRLNKEELNKTFASDIRSMFTHTIDSYYDFPMLKQYIQFIYNIFSIIDQNRSHLTNDYFTSFLHIQLTTKEKIFLQLSNLLESKMPQYENLEWGFYETERLTNWIKSCKDRPANDYTELDNHIMTKQFKLMRDQNRCLNI